MKKPNLKKAFTLIELLVVIAIIGILASVVIASVNSAREKGRIGAAKHFEEQVEHVAGELATAQFNLNQGPAGTSAIDRSGNGRDVVLNGGSSWSTDTPDGSSYSFSVDGINGYAVGSKNLGISGDAEFTMCGWIKWNGTWASDFPSFMGNNTTGANNQGLSFTVNSGRPAVDFWANRFRASSAISSDVWHLVCGTKVPGLIGSTTKLYVDGVQVSGAVEGSNLTPNIIDSPAVIGRLDGTRWFKGLIDNVQFFSKTLIASEIETMYAEGLKAHSFALEE